MDTALDHSHKAIPVSLMILFLIIAIRLFQYLSWILRLIIAIKAISVSVVTLIRTDTNEDE